jgi:hypothetical protein
MYADACVCMCVCVWSVCMCVFLYVWECVYVCFNMYVWGWVAGWVHACMCAYDVWTNIRRRR